MNNWKTKKLTITITGRQANIILQALENESIDDMVGRGEYSFGRCYTDIEKKLDKAGFWD